MTRPENLRMRKQKTFVFAPVMVIALWLTGVDRFKNIYRKNYLLIIFLGKYLTVSYLRKLELELT